MPNIRACFNTLLHIPKDVLCVTLGTTKFHWQRRPRAKRNPHSWNKTTSSRALKSIASSWGSTYHAIILFIWSQEYKTPGHRMGWSYESAWLVYRHVFTPPIRQMLVWVRDSVGSGRQETEETTTTLPPWPTSYLAFWSNHAESIILTPGRIRTAAAVAWES